MFINNICKNGIYIFIVIILFIYVSLVFCGSDSQSNHAYQYPKSSKLIEYDPSKKHQSIGPSPPGPGWIDPFDMLGHPMDHSLTLDQLTMIDVENYNLKKCSKACESYTQRLVNFFLRAINIQETAAAGDSIYSIKLKCNIRGEDLNVLKHFGQHGNIGEELRKVSDIMSKIFSQATYEPPDYFGINKMLNWLKHAIILLLKSPEWMVVSSVLLMLAMALWFVFVSQSYRLAIFTVILTIFLVGFGFTWMRMYEEKEAEKYAMLLQHRGEAPYHCSGKVLAWYEHIYYRFFGIDCYEFFKMTEVRPIVKISPLDVLGVAISSMIVEPARNIGTAYGGFVGNLVESVPWYIKPLALPLSLIMPFIFVISAFALFLNYKFSIGFTGMHLIPSWDHSLIKRNNQYIEDISNTKINDNNIYQKTLFNDEVPLYLTNWPGLKKLSENLRKDSEIKEEKKLGSRECATFENNSSNLEESKSTLALNDVEETCSLDDCKQNENLKKRSKTIYTCSHTSEGCSSKGHKTVKTSKPSCSKLNSGDQKERDKDTNNVSDFKRK